MPSRSIITRPASSDLPFKSSIYIHAYMFIVHITKISVLDIAKDLIVKRENEKCRSGY